MRVSAATFVALLILSPHLATAQPFEVGATAGAGCMGSEGSLCDGTGPLIGAHAGWWIGDRLEIALRAAHLALPSVNYRSLPADADVTVTDRTRRFASLLFLYHFRRGKAVRPMLGLGTGRYTHASRTTCRPAGCEVLVPGVGKYRDSDVDAMFVVGLSGSVRDRWMWRGGWQAHRFGNEEGSTEEFFIGFGYRFGGP